MDMAITAPVAILMLLVTIELGYMLFLQSAIDGATRSAARQVRTGQVQGSGSPLPTFQTALCAGLDGAMDCAALSVDVESFGSFSSLSSGIAPLQFDRNGKMTNATFSAGGPSDYVAVRVGYTYQFMTPWVAQIMYPSGGIFLLSTVVFKNEPFPPS
ncbi:MAG TPA: TadE/TadG family type IV pilus assembly protein [Stellaceae bacterium]|nr:TadE/TadG family type IV pilus assembly protein [Stellaceae bacterium]